MTLQVRGLGLRSAADSALPCFLASTLPSSKTLGLLLVENSGVALEFKGEPSDEVQGKQSEWDKIAVAYAQSQISL